MTCPERGPFLRSPSHATCEAGRIVSRQFSQDKCPSTRCTCLMSSGTSARVTEPSHVGSNRTFRSFTGLCWAIWTDHGFVSAALTLSNTRDSDASKTPILAMIQTSTIGLVFNLGSETEVQSSNLRLGPPRNRAGTRVGFNERHGSASESVAEI